MMVYKKYYITVLFVLGCSIAIGQSKDEIQVLANSRLLHKTVFGTKDSATLEGLLAKTVTYGHSSARIQTRAEAIDGIIHNKSTYTDTSQRNYQVLMSDDDAAIVRYTMREMETNGEGKSSPLNLGIMLVWVKEKGKWKLIGRQAVKLQ